MESTLLNCFPLSNVSLTPLNLKYDNTNSITLEIWIDKLALTGHFTLFVDKQRNVWQPVGRILNQIIGAKELRATIILTCNTTFK